MARRSQLETYMDILRAVSEGTTKPTRIMYRANLNWERLKECMNFLVREGLLSEESNRGAVCFSITPKGRDVLGYFRKIEGELFNKRTRLAEVYARYR